MRIPLFTGEERRFPAGFGAPLIALLLAGMITAAPAPTTARSGSVSGAQAPACSLALGSLQAYWPVMIGQTDTRSFEIHNTGNGGLQVDVVEDCDHFSIVSGGGPGTVGSGQSLVVTVEFAPNQVGAVSCWIQLGTECDSVRVAGEAFSTCSTESPVYFILQEPDSTETLAFDIQNYGTDPLMLDIQTQTSNFTVLNGGLVTLNPSQSLNLMVEFNPTPGVYGSYADTVTFGDDLCRPVPLSGLFRGTILASVGPDPLDFGEVSLGDSRVMELTLTNAAEATDHAMGSASPVCLCDPDLGCPQASWSILYGESFDVPPGGQHVVGVRFEPLEGGTLDCAIEFSIPYFGVLTPVVNGTGVDTPAEPRIALHAVPLESPFSCANGPLGTETPCSAFNTEADLFTGYDVYLTVAGGQSAGGSPGGIGGMICGLDYDGATASGAGVFGWWSCSEFSFPGTSWPDSGSSISVAWTLPGNCQDSTVPGFESEGSLAVVGAFYVYAYGDDVFRVAPKGPGDPAQVIDCNGSGIDLSAEDLGAVAFSASALEPGCNPCLEPCASTTVGTPDGPAGRVPLRAWPNPSRGPVTLEFTPSAPGRVTVQVLDIAGRHVATLVDAHVADERRQVVWDARREDGRRVPPGVYFYRAELPDEVVVGKLTLLPR